MFRTLSSPVGVLPSVLQTIFQHYCSPSSACQLSLSYMGIYHEQIFDLLSPSIDFFSTNQLLLEETSERGACIPSLTTVNVNCFETVMGRLTEAKQRLAQIDGKVQAGSLTHSLTELYTLTLHHSTGKTCNKLTIVNLQGTERAPGKYIGALKAFGAVTSALANNAVESDNAKKQHVPDLDSKLTCLSRPVLSGHESLTVIACCSCEEKQLEETMSTLEFVQRIKFIRSNSSSSSSSGESDVHEERAVKESEEKVQEQSENEDWIVVNKDDLI